METEEKKIYTIEDIARELGVSKTTVSRAISGKGRISQATRERVQAFIKEEFLQFWRHRQVQDPNGWQTSIRRYFV